ncbi:MAG: hypothetical protein GC190_16055 [Alphaproteobacteria bacterium]|nr:hypothetical protein [Alphaproteobacteria bacterium]
MTDDNIEVQISADTSTEADPIGAKIALGEDLRRARYMPLTGSCISNEALNLVKHVTARVLQDDTASKTWKEAGPARVERAVTAFLADLLFAEERQAGLWLFRSGVSNSFSGEEVGYRAYLRVRRTLAQMGLIEERVGFNPRGELAGRSWTSRLRGTPALFDLAQSHGVDIKDCAAHFRKGTPSTVLELRRPVDAGQKHVGKPRSKRMRFQESYLTRRLKTEVQEINTFLASRKIEGCTHDGFKRIFTHAPRFNWDKHGRLYSVGPESYQQLPKEERRLIQIDRESVVELDIRACSLTIAYALLGEHLDVSADPYAIDALPRGVAKSWVTMTLGHSAFHKRWSRDAVDSYLEGNPGADRSTLAKLHPIQEVQRLVLERHPVLCRYHESGITMLDLMFKDSEIMVNTVLRLIRQHQAPSLPVHDSLIVRLSDSERAHCTLREEFKRVVGTEPYIKM